MCSQPAPGGLLQQWWYEQGLQQLDVGISATNHQHAKAKHSMMCALSSIRRLAVCMYVRLHAGVGCCW